MKSRFPARDDGSAFLCTVFILGLEHVHSGHIACGFAIRH